MSTQILTQEAYDTRLITDSLIEDDYSNSRYGSTTCVCGETILKWVMPEDSTEIKDIFSIGICDDCGEDY